MCHQQQWLYGGDSRLQSNNRWFWHMGQVAWNIAFNDPFLLLLTFPTAHRRVFCALYILRPWEKAPVPPPPPQLWLWFFLSFAWIYVNNLAQACSSATVSHQWCSVCTERKTSTSSSKSENGNREYLQKSKKKKMPLQQLLGNSSSSTKLERPRSSCSAANLMAKKLVIRMLIVIVILFFICWTPIFSVNTWRAFDTMLANRLLSGTPISFIHLLSYISVCVNPIVYCFMNKRFRTSFLATFTCCAKQKLPVMRADIGEEEEGKTTGASLSRYSYIHMNTPAPPGETSNVFSHAVVSWLASNSSKVAFYGNTSYQSHYFKVECAYLWIE